MTANDTDGGVRRFGIYVLVGLINTIFGYAVFLVILAGGGSAMAALTGSTALGILFNFRSTGSFVFGRNDPSLLPRFIAVYAALFLVNAVLLNIAERSGLRPAYAQALLLPVMAVIGYWLHRRFVFTLQAREA